MEIIGNKNVKSSFIFFHCTFKKNSWPLYFIFCVFFNYSFLFFKKIIISLYSLYHFYQMVHIDSYYKMNYSKQHFAVQDLELENRLLEAVMASSRKLFPVFHLVQRFSHDRNPTFPSVWSTLPHPTIFDQGHLHLRHPPQQTPVADERRPDAHVELLALRASVHFSLAD